MEQTAEILIAIGVILLLGMATDLLGKWTFLPRVTLVLLFGIVIGDQALGLIPGSVSGQFELITDMALMMIGFLLGGPIREYILFSLTLPGYMALMVCAPGYQLHGIKLGLLMLFPLVIIVVGMEYHLLALLVGLSVSGQQRRQAGAVIVLLLLAFHAVLWLIPPLSYLTLLPAVFDIFGTDSPIMINSFFGIQAPVMLISLWPSTTKTAR